MLRLSLKRDASFAGWVCLALLLSGFGLSSCGATKGETIVQVVSDLGSVPAQNIIRDPFFRDPKAWQIIDVVNTQIVRWGPLTIERDNDNWGEYISARALHDPHGSHDGMVKLITDDDGHRPFYRVWGSGRRRFIINVYLRSDQPGARAEFATVRDTIFQRLLPAISATHIRKTDDLES